MHKKDRVRLYHMLEAAQQAQSFIKNKTRASLNEDRQLIFALMKSIEIIGEAAAQLSESSRQEFSQIPWKNIISMRNRLIHAYFDINLDILWQTINQDLPPLVAELEKIVSDL